MVLLVPVVVAPAGTAYRLPANIMTPASAATYLVELIGNDLFAVLEKLDSGRRGKLRTDWALVGVGRASYSRNGARAALSSSLLTLMESVVDAIVKNVADRQMAGG